MNRVTEYKENSEGCDSILVLKNGRISKLEKTNETLTEENKALRKSVDTEKENVKTLKKENEDLQEDVNKEKKKTKGVGIAGAVLALLILIFG